MLVLDHGHLELARQEHDRQHGEDRQPHPAGVAARDALQRREQRLQPGIGAHAREDVGDAVVHAVGDEQAHGEEGEQLDDGLEGDRRHHALVMLGSIQVPRAEQDGERSENHGHPERGVSGERMAAGGGARRHADLRILQKDRVAGGDRLQLQRDVGQDADHRDHRHQTAQQRALAVAGSDEVGERGDPARLADADDLAHHQPP
jgi:hypothetical protein